MNKLLKNYRIKYFKYHFNKNRPQINLTMYHIQV